MERSKQIDGNVSEFGLSVYATEADYPPVRITIRPDVSTLNAIGLLKQAIEALEVEMLKEAEIVDITGSELPC